MSEERPDALLKSALEKIVYFEARSEQLARDVESSRLESEAFKRELASAAQREIELRRELAEREVQAGRAHREREELSRVNEALRQERAALIGKLVEASRIHGADKGDDSEADFDLASFIAELRSEALARPKGQALVAVGAKPAALAATAVVARPSTVAEHAERLLSEGRLAVTPVELSQLSARAGFPGRTEETLFGFSVRELSSPDVAARIRAAERLKSLATPAAAPALATALHGESAPEVQVALVTALGALGTKETAPLVSEHLASPTAEVRIAALKALLALDPGQVAPHLAAAMRDPDRSVRRRASLFALGLSGDLAFRVGEQAVTDEDVEVRSLGARVLGAAGGDRARALLQARLRDRDLKVRRAAAEGLSRILGEDVSAVVALDEVQLRREVRRLATLPAKPVTLSPEALRRPGRPSPVAEREAAPETAPAHAERLERVAESLPVAAPESPEVLCGQLLVEVRSALRGRTLPELVQSSTAPEDVVGRACELLVARGQFVRRGLKYFIA